MKKNIGEQIKPISQKALEDLMDYHERQLLKMDPAVLIFNIRTKTLLNRGLIVIKPYLKNNQTIQSIYITSLGIYYLSKMCSVSNN